MTHQAESLEPPTRAKLRQRQQQRLTHPTAAALSRGGDARPLLRPVLLLVWYLLAALAVPSLLQASIVSAVVLLYAIVYGRVELALVVRQTWLGWSLVGLGLAVGLIFSQLPAQSTKGLADALRAFLLYLSVSAILLLAPRDMLRSTAAGFLSLASGAVVVIALALWWRGGVEFPSLREHALLTDYLGNYHEFASLVALLLLAVTCHWMALGRSRWWLVSIASLSLVLIALGSRSNWLAVVAGMLLIASVGYRRRLLSWASLVGLVVLTYWVLVATVPTATLARYLAGSDSMVIRIDILWETLQAVREHPWVGHGLVTFKHLRGTIAAHHQLVMPHNVYAELLYSVGVVGFSLVLVGAVTLAIKCRLLPLLKTPPTDRFLLLLGTALIAYGLTRGLVDLKLLGFEYLGLLGFAAACVTAAGLQSSARTVK